MKRVFVTGWLALVVACGSSGGGAPPGDGLGSGAADEGSDDMSPSGDPSPGMDDPTTPGTGGDGADDDPADPGTDPGDDGMGSGMDDRGSEGGGTNGGSGNGEGNGSDNGSGNGEGNGSDNGSGNGEGNGSDNGEGNGSDNGSGNGSGNGSTGQPCDAGCSANASCVDDVCACDAGFQDNDGDGTCTVDCASSSCGANKVCDDSGGTATCSCADGFQDNDGDGNCESNCALVDCGANSACNDMGGAPACECNAGFQDKDGDGDCSTDCDNTVCGQNALCDDSTGTAVCGCVAGTQDEDGDGDCSADCDNAGCGENTTCDASTGTAVCACAAGFQDKDGNGDCSADCDNAGCGSNTSCTDETGTAVCSCNAGTQDEDGDGNCLADCNNAGCGLNTVCEQTTGTAICSCAGGFQDGDADGDCLPDCDNTACDNGTCGITDGVAVCGCSLGWAGAACDSCATGFSGESCNECAGGYTDFPTCDECEADRFGALCESCPACANGACDAGIDGSGVCVCEQGWEGELCDSCAQGYAGAACDTCATGYADTGLGEVLCETCDLGFFGETCQACPACANGTCDDGMDGSGSCECDARWDGELCDVCAEGYTGAACDECAAGYQDIDNDGVCELECGGGVCDGLEAARGLETGVHDFTLLGGDVPMYVDGDYDGGAWILVGRGREGWDWTNDGRGEWSAVKDDIGTQDAFDPTYLPSVLIQHMMDVTPGAPEGYNLEIRLKRATDSFGVGYQNVRWQWTVREDWDWLFDVNDSNAAVLHTVEDSALGNGVEDYVGNTRDVIPNNGHQRVFTWAWGSHGGQEGFSYGSAVNNGSSLDQDFLWESGNENHAIPYTEVYIRIPTCEADTCSGNGECDDSLGLPVCDCFEGSSGDACETCAADYQDNDNDGTCALACAVDDCPDANEYCFDTTGAVECLTLDGVDCATILAGDAGAADGRYVIDPDGVGVGMEPVDVYCDMAGGGWTRVSFEDFDGGVASPDWSDARVDTDSSCAVHYGPMLGGYALFGNGADTDRTFDLLGIPHTEVRVQLDYMVLDSWDGESAVVRVEGVQEYSQAFSHGGGADGNVCGAGWAENGRQSVDVTVAHTTNTVNVEVDSTLNQGPTDESFGVDNVSVFVR